MGGEFAVAIRFKFAKLSDRCHLTFTGQKSWDKLTVDFTHNSY